MTYLCTFTACKRGAIGRHDIRWTRTVEADDPDAARLKLYDEFDHIHHFEAKPQAAEEAK